jgi:hypothetical protein
MGVARICSGKIGRRMRKNHNTHLDIAPVSTIDTLVGASAYVTAAYVKWNQRHDSESRNYLRTTASGLLETGAVSLAAAGRKSTRQAKPAIR